MSIGQSVQVIPRFDPLPASCSYGILDVGGHQAPKVLSFCSNQTVERHGLDRTGEKPAELSEAETERTRAGIRLQSRVRRRVGAEMGSNRQT